MESKKGQFKKKNERVRNRRNAGVNRQNRGNKLEKGDRFNHRRRRLENKLERRSR